MQGIKNGQGLSFHDNIILQCLQCKVNSYKKNVKIYFKNNLSKQINYFFYFFKHFFKRLSSIFIYIYIYKTLKKGFGSLNLINKIKRTSMTNKIVS